MSTNPARRMALLSAPLLAAMLHAAHAEPLGTVHFPVSCTPAAQADFDGAMALLHHMTYPQARAGFEALAARDPGCAMAHWGIAMTLFQPLWPTRPGPAELQRGRDAVQAARAAGPASERERLFIAAAGAFFDPPGADYWARIAAWEIAMQAVHAAFPDDVEATAFTALAHLATTPAGAAGREHADRAAGLLAEVLAAQPEHPGAMHYLVHANDVPGREHESLDLTRRYETIAPRNPHALHMPTHIYTRLGDWAGVVRGNRLAAEAALEHRAGAQQQYTWDEFAHAIEYLVYAHLQRGEDAAAIAERARLLAVTDLEPSFKSAFHHASTQARIALERRDWAAARAIVPRTPAFLDWDKFPWPEAIAVFAQARAALETDGDQGLADADAALARLDALAAKMQAAGETLFERSIRVLRLELAGWTLAARGDFAGAEASLREAAALEAATPKHAVTPGPTLPAEEQLGDLLLARDRPADARAAYGRSLAAYPNRFNSLFGAMRASVALGDADAVEAWYAKLEASGTGDRAALVDEARRGDQLP